MLKTILLTIMSGISLIGLYAPISHLCMPTTHAPHACQAFHQINTEQAMPFGAKMGKFIKECRLEEDNYEIKKVVIDPGHGGRDRGTISGDTVEKQVALDIAKKLGKMIQANYPEVQIIYTRTKDVFVPLHRRADIANSNQADLFLSIHCNAMRKADYIKGSETFVMGLDTAEENLEMVKQENASILLEDNYQTNYSGYDPNSSEGHIFMSMYQNAYLEQSILLAEQIEKQMKYKAGRKSRGVKQADFVVLRQTAMPSVLVETGYLSNETEHDFLSSSGGQEKISTAIFKAFRDYKFEVERL